MGTATSTPERKQDVKQHSVGAHPFKWFGMIGFAGYIIGLFSVVTDY